MNFKDKILTHIVEPHSANNASGGIGSVTYYDKYNNFADVFVSKILGTKGCILKHVPVCIPAKGIHSAALKVGDKVYLQFNNNSVFNPKIVGIADEIYGSDTRNNERHSRKGATAVNVEKSSKKLRNPSFSSWIDVTNTDEGKYELIAPYSKISTKTPVNNLYANIENTGFFKSNEVGLFHTKHSSITKIKNDGCVDAFVATDVGTRINRKNKTVEVFGNFYNNSDKWEVISNIVKITAKKTMELKSKKLYNTANTYRLKTKAFYFNDQLIDIYKNTITFNKNKITIHKDGITINGNRLTLGKDYIKINGHRISSDEERDKKNEQLKQEMQAQMNDVKSQQQKQQQEWQTWQQNNQNNQNKNN